MHQSTFHCLLTERKTNSININHALAQITPHTIKYIPPKHAPNAIAHTNGCNGKFNAFFSANEIATFTIIVVNGILSTKADAIADTHKIIKIATANRDSSFTDNIIYSVWVPIQSIKPSSDRDSIKTNSAAKNNNVDHSTRAKTDSKSSRSERIRSSTAPNNAVQPSDSF